MAKKRTFLENFKKELPMLRKKYDESKYSQKDLEFMQSLSGAVMTKSPVKSSLVLWVSFLAIAWLLLWASFAEVDEITKGSGKVVPSEQVQVIQNLEGGIVSKILIKEGQHVKKGDILIKIDDKIITSSFNEQILRLDELKAKATRLKAQMEGKSFDLNKKLKNKLTSKVCQNEQKLYTSNMKQLNKTIEMLNERVNQKQFELANLKDKIRNQVENYNLILEEIAINKPLYKKGIISKVEYLKLIREANRISSDVKANQHSIPTLKSEIKEAKQKISEEQLKFKNSSSEEYNKISAEIDRIVQKSNAIEDKVDRTMIESPVDGIVKQIFINTVGGVIKPGMDICEIVPSSKELIIEAKIKPSDIAFLYPNQEAVVKFTAYDFAIHGGLKGKVVNISADTIVDEEGDSYYMVSIKTDKNYLGTPEDRLDIIIGMTAEVDILTGKKTILDYLLKPILKAKNSALREK